MTRKEAIDLLIQIHRSFEDIRTGNPTADKANLTPHEESLIGDCVGSVLALKHEIMRNGLAEQGKLF